MQMPPFLVGVDVGLMADYTALSFIELRKVTIGSVTQYEYHARCLNRFELGTPYPDMVEKTAGLLKKLPGPGAWQEDQRRIQRDTPSHRKPPPQPLFILIVDATGVGRGPVDMFSSRKPTRCS